VGADFEWDHSRGADFRCLAQTMLAIEKYPSPQTVTLAPLEKWLVQPDAVIEKSFRDRIHKVYQTWVELIRDDTLNKAFKSPSKIAPIEFVLIGLLISVLMDTRTLAQLSEAIRMMRDDVRAKHVDIRLNDRVGRTMLEFIKGLSGNNATSTAPEGPGEVNLVSSLKRKRDEKAETPTRRVVKKETPEISLLAATPSGTSVANRPAPQPIPRSSLKPTVIPTTVNSPIPGGSTHHTPLPPFSRDRLAGVRQAQQADVSPRLTPPGSFSTRGVAMAASSQPGRPATTMPPPPRKQMYSSLQESLVASLRGNAYVQEGYGGSGSGSVDGTQAGSQNQWWEYGGPNGRAGNNRDWIGGNYPGR
jgi:hypothetical protein